MTIAGICLLRSLRRNAGISAINTQVLKRPLVIEKERINFD